MGLRVSTDRYCFHAYQYDLTQTSKDTLQLFDLLWLCVHGQKLSRIATDIQRLLQLITIKIRRAIDIYEYMQLRRCRKKTVALPWPSSVNMWPGLKYQGALISTNMDWQMLNINNHLVNLSTVLDRSPNMHVIACGQHVVI